MSELGTVLHIHYISVIYESEKYITRYDAEKKTQKGKEEVIKDKKAKRKLILLLDSLNSNRRRL